MPPYERPELGAHYNGKYIRIINELHVGENREDSHARIAEQDELEQRINVAKQISPAEVDAGIFYVTKKGQIFVLGKSTTFNLPVRGVERLARELTREVFEKKSPDHKVEILK